MSVCNYATLSYADGRTEIDLMDVCRLKYGGIPYPMAKITCDENNEAEFKIYSGSECNGTWWIAKRWFQDPPTVTASDCDKKACDYMWYRACTETNFREPFLVDVCYPYESHSVKLSREPCNNSSKEWSIAAFSTADCTGDRVTMNPWYASYAACMESGSVSGQVEACVNRAPGNVNVWINLALVAVLTAALAMM